MDTSTSTKMHSVTLYTLPNCQFCEMAKNLLHSKQKYAIYEIDLSENSTMREGVKRSLGATVPQIVIEGVHIGGYRELEDYFNTWKQ